MESLRRLFPLIGVPLVLTAAGCTESVRRPAERPLVYWSAEDFAAQLGMRLTQQSSAGATMTDGRNTLTIQTGRTGLMFLNGQRLGPPNNAVYQNGKVYVLAARASLVRWELEHMVPSAPPPVVPPPMAARFRATIVVDAGHGGKDPGTNGRGRSYAPEKDIVLAIARDLAQQLRERGGSVIMTRWGDSFLELDDRCRVAEKAHADLFVSIHADSARRADASGTTLYIGRSASNESLRAARAIEAALLRSGVECNGIQTAGYRVLVGHSRPAVLIECGFLTNAADCRRLNSPAYRAALAQAIADGIAAYFSR
jgi:N-acetylmuramoyl-L-alanine amidase